METSERLAPGDVIVVPFPYSDQFAEKRRPAVVIATLKDEGLLWVLMITSAANRGWADDVEIDDLELAGLPKASVVRPAKIACMARDRVLRKTGRLTAATAANVRGQVIDTIKSGTG